MDLTEALICGAIEALGGGSVTRPWGEATDRLHAALAAEDLCRAASASMPGVDPTDPEAVRAKAEALGIATAGKDPDVVVSEVFEEVVEDRLDGPIFVIDYPAAICP